MGWPKKKGLEEFPGGLAVRDLAPSLLWCGFGPGSGKFHGPWVWAKKKKGAWKPEKVYINI